MTDGLRSLPRSAPARCRRCNGPLFVTGSPDWGLCLPHGEQCVVPDDIEVDGRQAPTHLKRPGQLVGESYYAGRRASRQRRKRTVAEVEALNRPRMRPGPAPRPDAGERRTAKQRVYNAAYRASLSPEQAARQAAQRAAYKREWRRRRAVSSG